METPPRHYAALAFLPIVLVVITVVALYLYQQGATERRDRWQRPQAILDALEVAPGMRAAELEPNDRYFVDWLAERVGVGGRAFAVRPTPDVARSLRRERRGVAVVSELPDELDVVLDVRLSTTEQSPDAVRSGLDLAFERLRPGGRFGLIGLRTPIARRAIGPGEARAVAARLGFEFAADLAVVEHQFLLIVSKPFEASVDDGPAVYDARRASATRRSARRVGSGNR